MIFSEMFQTKLNAMVYARCLWNTEGKNRMQLMKGHLPLVSATSGARYDVCLFESNTLPREKIIIPENNGKKMFELDDAEYARIAGGKFFFIEVVSQNNALNPNFAFSTLEEAQRFASSYVKDTRALDVMFRRLTQEEAVKLPPQPAQKASQSGAGQPQQSQEQPQEERRAEEQAAAEPVQTGDEAQAEAKAAEPETEAKAEEEPLVPNRPPVNMTAYDRFCLDLSGIEKRQLLRFQYPFISPVTQKRYDTFLLESRSKPFEEVAIPEVDGKPVVPLDEASYRKIQNRTFYFIEIIESGHTLVPNLIFEKLDDAKRYLYGFKMDTRGLDVMFRNLTQEEAVKLGAPQPALAPESVSRPQAEQAEEAASAQAEEPAAEEPQAAQQAQEAEAAQQETQAEPEAAPEEAAASAQEEAAEEAAQAAPEPEPAAEAAAAEPEAEAQATPEPEITVEAEPETAATAENAQPEETAAAPEEAEELAAEEARSEQQEPEAASAAQQEQPEAEQAQAEEPEPEVSTPPISMAVYSRFCLDTEDGLKEDLCRFTADYASDKTGTHYEVRVYLGKSKKPELVKIPEINGKPLFDLPVNEYAELARRRFYFIEVTSDGQTTVLNKIFTTLDAAQRYIAAYEQDIRELDVMFRKITPREAAEGGAVAGRIWTPPAEPEKTEQPEEAYAEEAPAKEPAAEAAEEEAEAAEDEDFEEQTVETKTYIDENGDEVEEEVVTVTKTLFEDDDEEYAEEEAYEDDAEYADGEEGDAYDEQYEEEYADGEDADTEFVDDGEEYAEEYEAEGSEEEAYGDEAYEAEEYAEEEQAPQEAAEEAEKAEKKAPQRGEVAAAGGKNVASQDTDKLVLDRVSGGSVIYNQPIYAKEVYIQFPNHFSTVNAAVSGDRDLFASANARGGYNEVDFERYLNEVNRAAYGGEFEDMMHDAEREEDFFGGGFFDPEGDPFDEYSRMFGEDDTEDIFGGLLNRHERDDYDDIMRMFRSDEKQDDFWNLF